MQTLFQDLRCGARTLQTQSGVALVILLTLNLMTAAGTAIINDAHKLLIRTSAVRDWQQPVMMSPDSLADVLAAAQQSARVYNQIFRDLTATETRATELFERGGEPDGQRVTMADLIVYQSRFDERTIYECRLFTSIDGKAVNVSEQALRNFFEKATRVKALEQERALFREKNKEHAYHYYFYHRTLNPAWMAQPEWRDRLEFSLAGREQIEGRETVVVVFRQKEAAPIEANDLARRQLRGDFKNGLLRWHGRLWVDVTTGHLWRIEKEGVLEYADTPTPLVMMGEVLEFMPSAYGIHVPKRFVADWNFHAWRAKDGQRRLARRVRFTDKYSAFRRFATSGQERNHKEIVK